MSGYDTHLMIKHIASEFPDGNLRVIAENTERYISVSVDVVVGMYTDKKGDLKPVKIELRFINSL